MTVVLFAAGCGRQEVSQTSVQPSTPAPATPVARAPIMEVAQPPVVLATPPPRLAPEGVYYLLRPVSITTESGVYSARAGSRMILVEKGERTWFVTNERGTEFSVHPSDLTNNLDEVAQLQKPKRAEEPVNSVVAAPESPQTFEPQPAFGGDSSPPPAEQPGLTAEVEPSVAPAADPAPAPPTLAGLDYVTQHKIRTLRAQIFYSSQELASKQAQLDGVYNARERGGSINRIYYYPGTPYSYAHSRKITSSNGSEFVLKKEIDLLNKKLDVLKMQLAALTGE